MNALITTLVIALAAIGVLAQEPIDGDRGYVVVTSLKNRSTGYLTADGTVTANPALRATFNAKPESDSLWDGATLDAGNGVCGWNLNIPAAPLVCTPKASQKTGFFVFDGKLATLEWQTEWFLDNTPGDPSTKTLYWQGLHPDSAVLTWVHV